MIAFKGKEQKDAFRLVCRHGSCIRRINLFYSGEQRVFRSSMKWLWDEIICRLMSPLTFLICLLWHVDSFTRLAFYGFIRSMVFLHQPQLIPLPQSISSFLWHSCIKSLPQLEAEFLPNAVLEQLFESSKVSCLLSITFTEPCGSVAIPGVEMRSQLSTWKSSDRKPYVSKDDSTHLFNLYPSPNDQHLQHYHPRSSTIFQWTRIWHVRVMILSATPYHWTYLVVAAPLSS